MMELDEDALICDLAEYYNIYEHERIAPLKVAILACGLRDDSRIKMKISGCNVSTDTIIKAAILDNLSFIAWTKTKDAQSGKNAPESLVAKLQGKDKKENDDVFTFENPDDFFEMRESILKG